MTCWIFREITISEDNYQASYAIISKYFQWNVAIDEFKKTKYNEIYQEVISYDQTVKTNAPKVYYDYVLNTLPCRSYKNILSILKNKNIPEIYRKKLECAVNYCKLSTFDATDDTILNIFIVENNKTQENILLTLRNLDYLNSKNTAGFTLEQFHLNFFTKSDKDNGITIESQSFSLNNFHNIRLPQYLKNLISNKFTASNVVAKHIYSIITKMITQYQFNVTLEQSQKLEEICYQITSDLNQDITLSLDFKKKLIANFKDDTLLNGEIDIKNNNGDITEVIPAGDFFQIINHLMTQKLDGEIDNEKLQQLPYSIVVKAESLEFTQNHKQILDDFFVELKQLSSTIFEHEASYILGLIFMEMSSVYKFGYLQNKDNIAFNRYRLLGGYWLSKAIALNDACLKDKYKWSNVQKLAISQEIRNAILTIECSNTIFTKLYGKDYCVEALKPIYKKMVKMLGLKLN